MEPLEVLGRAAEKQDVIGVHRFYKQVTPTELARDRDAPLAVRPPAK